MNIVKAGLLIGREQSLFIVLSGATGRPLVGGLCGDCTVSTIQLARCTTTGSGQPFLQYLLSQYNAVQCNTMQYNAVNKEIYYCIET